MAVKRHFSGKPVGEEYSSSSEDEGLESDREEEQVRPQKSVKAVNIGPIGNEIKPDVPKDTVASELLNDRGLDEALKSSDKGEEAEEEDEDSGSEESDESDSDSDSDSESDSSDDEPKLLKPVFLSKSKRAAVQSASKTSQEKAQKDKERALKTIETHINQDIDQRKQLEESFTNLGGVDDTDDLDPELERTQWELRKLKREERDRAKLEKEQDELEELENRRLRTEEERIQEFNKLQAKEREDGDSNKQKVKGAFFRDEDLLKRDLGEENEKYDKSLLPQKYDPKKKD